jgi:raffinose/stachyose/melibiose transport system substrate-binding protein
MFFMNRRLHTIGLLVILVGMLSVSMVARAQASRVVYFSMFSQGEPLQLVLQEATDQFMVENPDIQVETVWAGRNNLTQLASVLAAGDQVDIVDHSDDRVYNAVVVNDLALPLDDYLEGPAYNSDVPWQDTFVPGALEIGRSPEDGHIYLIPRDDYISTFFYNTAIFEELGIEPPTTGLTWEEFTEILDAVAASGVTPIGADGTISFYNNWYPTYLMIRLAGVEAFRDAAYDQTGESWRQPEFLQAAQLLADLQTAGRFQDGFEGSVWPAAQVQWVNGDPAMMFMGAWLPAEMKPQMPADFSTGMFAFPTIEGGLGNEVVEHWANTYAVLNTSPNPDAAVEYIKYIMSPEVVEKIVAIDVPVPIVDAPVPTGLEAQYEILGASTPIAARAGLNTEIPEYMETVYNVCSDQLFQMQIGPEAYIDCLVTTSATYWASKSDQ